MLPIDHVFRIFGTIALTLLLSGCGGGGGSSSSSSTPPSDPLPSENPEPLISINLSLRIGPLPLLVIRVAYSDRAFVSDAQTWSDKFFGTSLHQLNDYYYEASNGKFQFGPAQETQSNSLVSDGVITVTLNKPHPDTSSSATIQPDLAAAVMAADPYINFASYDSNGDGGISTDELQIIFIIAGYEDAYSGGSDAPGVWAHSSCTATTNTPRPDGVGLLGCAVGGSYSLFGERHGSHDATIGIIAHELGHAAFLLPDLYDTDGSSSGLGYFGLMASGSWGTANSSEYVGATPTHPCAWSKIAVGWVSPQVVSALDNVPVTLFQSASVSSNIVKVPISDTEYFLLENRDNSGYDRGLYKLGGEFDGGLAILHVDETVITAKDPSNTVNNNEAHKGVDLEEAAYAQLDTGGSGHERNLYYSGNRDAFSPTTDPNSDSYVSSGTGISISGISARGAMMQATVTNPN